MRRALPYLLLVLVIGLAATAVGCVDSSSFYKSTTTAPADLQTGSDLDPQSDSMSDDQVRALLEDMMAAAETMGPSTASFEAEMRMNLVPGDPSVESDSLLGLIQGLKVTGDMTTGTHPDDFDLDVTLSTSGITYNMGVRSLAGDAWVSVLGQWYEITPALQEMYEEGGLGNLSEGFDTKAVEDLMTELGIDPLLWLGTDTTVTQETLAGSDVYHLTCSPDTERFWTDVILILVDGRFFGLLDPSGELLQDMDLDLEDITDITEQELREARDDLTGMLDSIAIEFWVDKESSLLKQMRCELTVVPPAGEDPEGVESVDLELSMTLDESTEPVAIEAPEDFLPYSAFEDLFSGSGLPLPEGLGSGAEPLSSW